MRQIGKLINLKYLAFYKNPISRLPGSFLRLSSGLTNFWIDHLIFSAKSESIRRFIAEGVRASKISAAGRTRILWFMWARKQKELSKFFPKEIAKLICEMVLEGE